MDTRIRHDLMSLESQDIVRQRFKRIHSRDLNARRAREINAAAKQAREYFRNSSNADYSVRPLLTFYGVTSLSRALVLLLREEGGEECLTSGHGLETAGWREVMSGNTLTGLSNLSQLKVRRCSGLFSDFLEHTRNTVLLQVGSWTINWNLSYDIPNIAMEISVGDLFSRIPDLRNDYSILSGSLQHAHITDLSFNKEDGLRVTVNKNDFAKLSDYFISRGYSMSNRDNKWCVLSCDAETFQKVYPLFIRTYLEKPLGWLKMFHMATPLPGGECYSQLCITYMVSFILGMLARYFPTHWMTLIHGSKGDSLWPAISRAQEAVEHSFPELVAEYIGWKADQNNNT